MKRKNVTVAIGKIQQGFTLIELMIVVVIVAIIASIGYPSYTNYTTKARRAAAEGFMMNVATKQEQYFLDARTYTTTVGAGGLALAVPDDVAKHYTVTVAINAAGAPPSYTITATPVGAQLTQDTKCGTLTLTQSGAKTPASDCW